MIWGIYRLISDLYPGRNRFCQRNFSFLKIFICFKEALYTSFRLFLGNYKCISTGITSSLCPQGPQNSSRIFKGSFLICILGEVISLEYSSRVYFEIGFKLTWYFFKFLQKIFHISFQSLCKISFPIFRNFWEFYSNFFRIFYGFCLNFLLKFN